MWLPRHPGGDTRHRQRMHQRGRDAAGHGLGLVEDAELPQHRRPVVVDPLAREALVYIEAEDAAEREFDVTAGRRQAPPRRVMPAADDGLEDDRTRAGMPLPHVDHEVRQRPQQIRVETGDRRPPRIMRGPGLVVIPSVGPEVWP